jgi:hypothetical protein
VRVPFATGLACATVSGQRIVALLPPDASRYSAAAISGYLWRDSLSQWHPVEPTTISQSAVYYWVCLLNSPIVQPMGAPNWTPAAVGVSPVAAGTQVGAPIILYERVTYRFGPSQEMPGRRALWRILPGSGKVDELVTPFDTAARFQPIVGRQLVAQSGMPASMDSVYGVRIRLIAASDARPAGRSAPVTFDLTTDILFRNRAP